MTNVYTRTITAASLAENSSQSVDIDGTSVLLCRSGGEYFAVKNQCTHQDAPLLGGRVRNRMVSCPLHGMRYELATGKPFGQLSHVPLATYPVRIVDGFIEIAVAT
ncbi:MAG: Rieske 2Fe-2S domain-containing protein [Gammaproteobacteria bacterium]|nr:Rieske 2Fe-2S domain-containing protein [Gammaproteobacteria bacterium]